jgi:hypothetical protein
VFRWAYGMDLAAMLDMDSDRFDLHRTFAEQLIRWQQPMMREG